MQALLENSQESFMTSNDLTPLNTQEASILNDSVDSETSAELFARVRRENAELYGSVNAVDDLADK